MKRLKRNQSWIIIWCASSSCASSANIFHFRERYCPAGIPAYAPRVSPNWKTVLCVVVRSKAISASAAKSIYRTAAASRKRLRRSRKDCPSGYKTVLQISQGSIGRARAILFTQFREFYVVCNWSCLHCVCQITIREKKVLRKKLLRQMQIKCVSSDLINFLRIFTKMKYSRKYFFFFNYYYFQIL